MVRKVPSEKAVFTWREERSRCQSDDLEDKSSECGNGDYNTVKKGFIMTQSGNSQSKKMGWGGIGNEPQGYGK